MPSVDFNRAPYTVIWEVTRACDLCCIHCRASAQKARDSGELTLAEGYRLLDSIAEFGSPVFVITGGDPMKRADLEDIIGYAARDKGLRTSLTPSATPLVTRDRLASIKAAGIARIALSLDGPRAAVHDAFRGERGCFDRTIEIIRHMQDLEIPLQINTTVAKPNVADLVEIARRVEGFGAVQWSVFFLVPMGRGKREDMISAAQHERIFHWLCDLKHKVSFDIKVTAAQHFRRVAIQRERRAGRAMRTDERGCYLEVSGAGFQYTDGIQRPTQGVNDGKGLVFISHVGDVYPSGFLPIRAGNVRGQSVVDIYRNSFIFHELRDPNKLRGKCGVCEYRVVCGGNRARAWAMTGDALAEEPMCVYVPPLQRAGAPSIPDGELIS
ncbi:MAG: radical SAM/SPASM domain-containing protein [Candidatus Lindowbacteria bacterium RIFCSPLOWO2_12_FULL_62_27]|nr:MAG: radical SAM/SPASM domain-containing protein [Candidatus Lindowbacteria bacterium RIFCSPLOWO2_12_FULL_62_27]OGH58792.1 MAG: radical SAM/SPASM domain-containing protein [Candidatus Lindowbacteria bacterium RIFCSPLOWO2_02_FULL_62_12]